MDIGNMGPAPMIGGTLTLNDVLTAPNVVCECGNKVFIDGVVYKRLSRILTGSSEDTIYPIPISCCSKCGKVPKELMEGSKAKQLFGEDKEEKSNTFLA